MLKTDSQILQILGRYFSYGFGANYYDDPFVIIQSISYFLFFEAVVIKSKTINFISRGVIEAYLIHANIYFREFEFKLFGLTSDYFDYSIVFYTLLIAIVIFIFSIFIFYIRKLLVNFILKISKKIKITNKIIENYHRRKISFDTFIN